VNANFAMIKECVVVIKTIKVIMCLSPFVERQLEGESKDELQNKFSAWYIKTFLKI
jgi:hypothetical protein